MPCDMEDFESEALDYGPNPSINKLFRPHEEFIDAIGCFGSHISSQTQGKKLNTLSGNLKDSSSPPCDGSFDGDHIQVKHGKVIHYPSLWPSLSAPNQDTVEGPFGKLIGIPVFPTRSRGSTNCLKERKGSFKMVVGEDIFVSKVVDFYGRTLVGHFCGKATRNIKGLPKGEMKTALLDTYVKTVKTASKGQCSTQKKQPLFLEASYEKNTKTYMKFNREPKVQELSLPDIASDLSILKKEVADLHRHMDHLQQEVDHAYPVDSWARQEILGLRERISHIPPPLEDAPYESISHRNREEAEEPKSAVEEFANMQVLTVSYQKYYVQISIEIQQEIFSLIALIDIGSDINLLHKEKIPAKYWGPSSVSVTGLGNNDVNFLYEIPRANAILEEYSIGMRFHIGEAHVDCILGTPFLSMLSPHGPCMLNEKPGYFLTIPALLGQPEKVIKLPFISDSYWQLGFLNCMVIIKQFNKATGKAEHHYYAEMTPWSVFKAAWNPTWQLRLSETMEIGLPGFSRNTNPTVIPSQHILGQMSQPIISTSREKLINLGDLTMLRTAETQWYEHSIRSWCRYPVYHSFQINHMRAVAEWPDGDPENFIQGLNYEQYKATWFHAFLWKSRFEFFYTQVRFAHMLREFEEPSWLMEWWENFGLNPVGVNPKVSETARMFPQWHRPLSTLNDLYSEEDLKDMFIQEKYLWILRTKFMLEDDPDNEPILLRQVYTQHWDPYHFHFNH